MVDIKELEKRILELIQSYDIQLGRIKFDELVCKNKLEFLSPSQLQKYMSEKYHIDMNYKDAEELELMILTHGYVGNKYLFA